MPPTPDAKPVPLARYAIDVTRARWQRRRAIQQLHDDIRQDTAALDHIFAALGRKAREHGLQNRATTAEHQAITTAEQLRVKLLDEDAHVRARSADEDARFAEVERGQVQRVGEAEQVLEAKQAVLTNVEAQRRALRDKRKEVERRQRGYEKAAETREDSAAQQPMGPERTQLRAAALEMRREAQTLDPERQDLDRKLAALETPVAEAQAEVDAAKAQLSIARDALNNSREGHTHRAAELGAEQKTKQRQLEDTEAEILRRLVTLGTLLNLERIVDPRLDELYGRIDRVRTAIAARGAEIDRLTQERAGHDRGAWMRGWAVIGGAVIGVLVLIAIALALT